jgi:hypothetical protein
VAINIFLIDRDPIYQTKNDAKKSFKIDVIKWLKFDVKMMLKKVTLKVDYKMKFFLIYRDPIY